MAEKALEAGGFKTGEMTPYIKVGDLGIGLRNYLPASKQEGGEARNKGIDVDDEIERSGAVGSWD